MYMIRSLCHRTDVPMGMHYFSIDLSPEFRQRVAKIKFDQDKLDDWIRPRAREWLDNCGFAGVFDPDNCGATRNPNKPPGPKARHSYEYGHHFRVTWGEWGPEHINVPGNACGLDIDKRSLGSVFGGGKHDSASLHPHNIDNLSQKYLLLVCFTEIAELIWWASTAPEVSK